MLPTGSGMLAEYYGGDPVAVSGFGVDSWFPYQGKYYHTNPNFFKIGGDAFQGIRGQALYEAATSGKYPVTLKNLQNGILNQTQWSWLNNTLVRMPK